MKRTGPREEIRKLVADVVASAPHASLDELNRRVGRHMEGYNTRPQADLGGLSPSQMAQLLYGDWNSGVLRLNGALANYEIDSVDFLHNARAVLGRLAQGPLKATQTGNLARIEVLLLVPHLRLGRAFEDLQGVSKVLNENDAGWLHLVRHTLMAAGLVARRKGFRITARGRDLLADEQAGALYASLFETLFRRIDLRGIDATDRHEGLQGTVAWSFFRLRTCAVDWTSPEKLAADAWLDSAKDPMTPSDLRYGDMRHWTFHRRVLTPLVMFGLLEERELPSKEKWSRPVELRKTPLFDRFLRFEFGG